MSSPDQHPNRHPFVLRLFPPFQTLNDLGNPINAHDMRAIGYVRVSTDRQADHGVSLEAQEAKIRAMATVQGAELIDVIVDGGESAKSMNRPGVQRLLSLVNAGNFEAVIIARPAHSQR